MKEQKKDKKHFTLSPGVELDTITGRMDAGDGKTFREVISELLKNERNIDEQIRENFVSLNHLLLIKYSNNFALAHISEQMRLALNKAIDNPYEYGVLSQMLGDYILRRGDGK